MEIPDTCQQFDDPTSKEKMKEFDVQIAESHDHLVEEKDFDENQEEFQTPSFAPYEDNETPASIIPSRDEFQGFNKYIGAEVLLTMGDPMKTGKV